MRKQNWKSKQNLEYKYEKLWKQKLKYEKSKWKMKYQIYETIDWASESEKYKDQQRDLQNRKLRKSKSKLNCTVGIK